MKRIQTRIGLLSILLAVGASSIGIFAQESKPSEEMASSESTFKIHAERNLVVVRVVVRDASGKAVTGLKKEDFRLLDNGKPQAITDFSVESPEPKPAPSSPAPEALPQPAVAEAAQHPPVIPDRFVALFFDNIHVAFEDLVRTRDAAIRYISTNLQPSDRVALFTSGGDFTLDFTSDREKLHDALMRVRQHPMPALQGNCPQMTEYQSYMIAEHHDPTALQVAEADALVECCAGLPSCPQADPNYLETVSRNILTQVEFSSRYALQSLESLSRRMATLPGQRSVVFLSPGFLTETEIYDLQQVIDRALRSGVVINTFDARGLYVDMPLGDASQQTVGAPQMNGLRILIHSESMMEQEGVLASLAAGTGGVYFHNSNDYDAGFRRTGGLPESAYVLTFSPQNLKYDGAFHKLKVSLVNPSKFSLQARMGYYAPKKAADAATQAKDDIEEAVFNRTESRDLPVDVNTRFFKTDDLNAKITVTGRVDVSSLHFLKDQDRHRDDIALVAVLFDSDGNYVTGAQSTYKMWLTDSTYDRVQRTGVFLKANLDSKVGTYLMRVIVRDAESGRMFAVNRKLDIPY